MSKESSTAVLGIFVAAVPFLGFPQSWRTVLFVLAGIAIAALGFSLRAAHLHREAVAPRRERLPRKAATGAKATIIGEVTMLSADMSAAEEHSHPME